MYFYPDAVSCTLLRLPREKRRLLLLWTQILCLGFPDDVVSTCSFGSFYAFLCLQDIWFWQCTSCCLSQVSYRHMMYTLMKDWPTYIYLCPHGWIDELMVSILYRFGRLKSDMCSCQMVIGTYRLSIMHNFMDSLQSMGLGSLNSSGDKALFYIFHSDSVLPFFSYPTHARYSTQVWWVTDVIMTRHPKSLKNDWNDWRERWSTERNSNRRCSHLQHLLWSGIPYNNEWPVLDIM